jgi:hypothetical protein
VWTFLSVDFHFLLSYLFDTFFYSLFFILALFPTVSGGSLVFFCFLDVRAWGVRPIVVLCHSFQVVVGVRKGLSRDNILIRRFECALMVCVIARI